MSNEITKRSQTMGALLQKNLRSITSVMPEGLDAKRLCRIAINACIKNPTLTQCKPATFLMSVMKCAEVGLMPDMDEAALVPYKGVVTFQPMYKGLLKLARQSGEVGRITAEVVREGDEFVYELGLNPILQHKPKLNNTGKLTHVYATAKLKDGDVQFVVMDESQVLKRKDVAKAKAEGTPWGQWEEEMWKKTALKKLAGLLPRDARLSSAVEASNQSDVGKAPMPVAVDVLELTDVDLNDIAGEGEGEGQIEPPKRKGKKTATPDVPPVSDEEMAALGWGKDDELPME